jgi:hypothetical protein
LLANELEAQLGFFAHQLVHAFGSLVNLAVHDLDLQQRALFGVHRGFFQLRRRHLAKAFKTADLDFAFVLHGKLGNQFVFFLVVHRVICLVAGGDTKQRWLRKIEMAVSNQLRHFLIKERHQQRGDMGAIHVSIRHDDNLLVA